MDVHVLATIGRLLGLSLLVTAVGLSFGPYSNDLIRRLVFLGGASLLWGILGGLTMTVFALREVVNLPLNTLLWDYLFSTSTGRWMLLQITMGLVATMGLLVLARSRTGQYRRAWRLMAMASVVLLSLAMAAMGHAAASHVPLLMISVTLLHIAGGVLWCAIVLSALAYNPVFPTSARLIRIGNWALATVTVIVCTGLWLGWQYGVRPQSVAESDYGCMVLLKGFLLAIALAVAGWNRWAIARGNPWCRTLNAKVVVMLRLEYGVLGLALVAAAILGASMPPAR